jgi:hypothetical protein
MISKENEKVVEDSVECGTNLEELWGNLISKKNKNAGDRFFVRGQSRLEYLGITR